jgi:hypothetical protein
MLRGASTVTQAHAIGVDAATAPMAASIDAFEQLVVVLQVAVRECVCRYQ